MTAGRHDGGPPLALPTRPYVCPLPSHQARTMRACSDNMGCASPRTRAVHAGMDVLERRCRSVVVVPTPLALDVALYTTADVAAQVRRCAQLQTRAHGALASHLSLHCISWQRRCSSRVLARVHGLHMRRHPRTGSGSRLHDDPARGRALALATMCVVSAAAP